jgi:hypothetical protein
MQSFSDAAASGSPDWMDIRGLVCDLDELARQQMLDDLSMHLCAVLTKAVTWYLRL